MGEQNTSGGGGAAVSLPVLAAGLYALLNHAAVHQAIHANIEPAEFAGMVAWAVWAMELMSFFVVVLLAALVVVLVGLAFWKLAEYTA